MIDDKVAYSWARNAHVLMGASFVLVGYLFGGWKWECGVATAVVAWAGAKEIWYDEKYETVDERGSGLRDWVEYAIGVAIGMAVCGLKFYVDAR